MAMSRTYFSVDGKIRGEHRQGETYSRDYLHDALGSVVAGFQNGNQVGEGLYKPYGFRDGEWQMDSYRFSWNAGWGYRRTGGLASNYVRARHYVQFSGGWNTVDPLWPKDNCLPVQFQLHLPGLRGLAIMQSNRGGSRLNIGKMQHSFCYCLCRSEKGMQQCREVCKGTGAQG